MSQTMFHFSFVQFSNQFLLKIIFISGGVPIYKHSTVIRRSSCYERACLRLVWCTCSGAPTCENLWPCSVTAMPPSWACAASITSEISGGVAHSRVRTKSLRITWSCSDR